MDRYICGRGKQLGTLVSDTSDIMSDTMSSQRITVRVSKALGARLRARSRAKGKTPSDLVRVAIENYLDHDPGAPSAYDRAKEAGLIGCIKDGPKDLATNPRYFEGFGRAK